MGFNFTEEGALRLASLIIASASMVAFIALLFESFVLSAAMALVAVLGCLAAILIIRNEHDKTL